jgi:pimeloyl-ACP methyl ester carboxylesterase
MKDEGGMMSDERVAVPAYEPRYVNVLDVETAYYEDGERDGRPLLLVHGMSASADTYRETMAALADSHWVLAVDLPGFGRSEETRPYTIEHLVEWLAAFRDELDLPPLRLLGHSFGGPVVTSFALSYPEDVASLALAAPALMAAAQYPDFVKKVTISLHLAEASTAVSQSKAIVRQTVRNSSFAPDKIDEAIWERRVVEYHKARASADVLKALAFYDVREELPRLQMPICIIWGENDPVLPIKELDNLIPLLPQAEVHRLPECGHLVMVEKEAEFVAILREFWKIED